MGPWGRGAVGPWLYVCLCLCLQEGGAYSPLVSSCWDGRGDRLLLWEPAAAQASAVLSGQAREIQPANRSLGGLCMHQSVDSEYIGVHLLETAALPPSPSA